MVKKLILFPLLMLAMFGCKTIEQNLVEQGFRELKADEIRTRYIGNTDSTSAGEFWYYSSDGRVTGRSKSGRSVTGTWRFNEEGKLCISWNDIYLPSGCSKFLLNDKTAEIIWLEPDGQTATSKLLPGNPKNF